MRPGEKMHETLTNEDEQVRPAPCDGLFAVHRPPCFTEVEVSELLQRMRGMIISGDTVEMRNILDEMVPGFSTRNIFAETVQVSEG